jgi:hypothetical protein
MTKLKFKIALRIVCALFLFCTVWFNFAAKSQAAGEVKLYLSPASASVKKNDILTLSLRENSNEEPVNVMSTNITYAPSALEFLSITPSAQFPITDYSYGAGVININYQATFDANRNDQPVATVQFKVLASSGSFSVTLDPTIGSGHSTLVSNGTNILQTVYSGSYNISQASPTPLPAAGTTKPPASTTSTSSTSNTRNVEQIAIPGIQNQRTLVPGQTSTIDESGNSWLDEVLLWAAALMVVVGAVYGRRIKRRYRYFRGRETVADVEHRLNNPKKRKLETIAEVAARINRRRIDSKSQTVAELAARMSALAKKTTSIYLVKLSRR